MSTPHKHAALIRAWADGAEIQGCSVGAVTGTEYWATLEEPNWASSIRYRIKPHRWQAEIDAQKAGKAVQCRSTHQVSWTAVLSELWFDDSSHLEFRIKPEMLRFRNYRRVGSSGTVVQTTHHEETSRTTFFGGWIGDWQEVEA